MKIRMKVDVSGLRNGRTWPKRGTAVDVSDAEGAELCAAGLAVPVSGADAETRSRPVDEERRPAPDDDVEKRGLTTEQAPAVAKKAPPRKSPAKKTAPAKPQTDSK
jgi:hypothetical protein